MKELTVQIVVGESGGRGFSLQSQINGIDSQGLEVSGWIERAWGETSPTSTRTGREGQVRRVKTEFLCVHRTQLTRVLLRHGGRARRD